MALTDLTGDLMRNIGWQCHNVLPLARTSSRLRRELLEILDAVEYQDRVRFEGYEFQVCASREILQQVILPQTARYSVFETVALYKCDYGWDSQEEEGEVEEDVYHLEEPSGFQRDGDILILYVATPSEYLYDHPGDNIHRVYGTISLRPVSPEDCGFYVLCDGQSLGSINGSSVNTSDHRYLWYKPCDDVVHILRKTGEVDFDPDR
jgi:hypothetical protein